MATAVALIAGAIATTAAAPTAAAQNGPGGDIDLQTFRPALDSRGFITVNGAQVLGHKEISFGLVTNWGRNVLRFQSAGSSYEVEHLLTPTLIGAVGLELSPVALELGMSLPFGVMAGDRGPDSAGVIDDPNDDASYRFDGQGIGDIGLHSKLRLRHPDRGLGVAVIGSLYLPTASAEESWLGAGAMRPQVLAVVEKRIGRLAFALNGGLRYRAGGQSQFRDDRMLGPDGLPRPVTDQTISVGSTVPLGLGVSYALAPQRFEVIGEVFGEVPLSGENYLPVEAVGGIKVYLARNSFLTMGGGAGLMPSAGVSPDLRAFIGIVFEPRIGDRDGDGLADDLDECPAEPEDFDDFSDADGCPDLDNDRDGILDHDDRCPTAPEDRDGVEDDDGCPESDDFDRDGDRIPDDADNCPDDPEDYDSFEDGDGCPDLDNDGDNILDQDDLCQDEAEDYDSFEDGDGCPEADNDRDRIADQDDECPNEPETYNTKDDEDGCPDRYVVGVGTNTIVVLDEIHFEYDSAVIKRDSYDLLGTIAATINLNPDLALLEVQGHTDERGSASYNMRLSRDRARAVLEFLVEAGVDEGRLRSRGYGETQPVESGHDEAAWAANRRVEFVIVKRESD